MTSRHFIDIMAWTPSVLPTQQHTISRHISRKAVLQLSCKDIPLFYDNFHTSCYDVHLNLQKANIPYLANHHSRERPFETL